MALLLAGGQPAADLPPYPRTYVCGRAATGPTIDGRLDDAAWLAAPWTAAFVDIEGSAKPRPLHRTRAKMVWDDACLYIGAQLDEPNVWATITQRDAVIFHDNDFEVFIDPDGDNHDYAELEMNALNTVWDLRLPKPYRDGGTALNEWDIAGLHTAVHVDGTLNDARDRDRGWSVEIAIPWSALDTLGTMPCPPRPGDQWRINFSRVEWQVTTSGRETRKVPDTPEYNWVWSPQGVVDMHRPETWGFVQFSGEEPGRGRFRRTGDWAARCRAMEVCRAQRAYHAAHGRWAATSAELRLGEGPAVTLALTREGWEARVPAPRGRTVRVRHDSQLAVE